MNSTVRIFCVVVAWLVVGNVQYLYAQMRTWDGKHSVDQIEVTMVYFVPKDGSVLPDWKERLQYYATRIERFHERELDGQSKLTAVIRDEPYQSKQTTEQLRRGDGNATFFKTLREVDEGLHFGQGTRAAFPILLVMSDINWRPLDDFYRVKPNEKGEWVFEGNYNQGRHFPGAESGGARATYLADRGVGWGLVSGDGWRVPYSGSDCVVYHEGVGHSIGLPHNEPGDGAVMSLGQYNGWINQSWLDVRQKKRLGWNKADKSSESDSRLFTAFTALPEPLVPKPNERVALNLNLPEDAKVESLRVRIQTSLHGPWHELTPVQQFVPNKVIDIGKFDRATPVSYRVDVQLADGQHEELWGYFQVRESIDKYPVPTSRTFGPDGMSTPVKTHTLHDETDVLADLDLEKHSVSGRWELKDRILTSPKEYGARIELPFDVPESYEMIVVVEPLDEPHGLILGQLFSKQRFLALIDYASGDSNRVSALENVNGKNVAENATRFEGSLLAKNRLSQVVVRVERTQVTVHCDGTEVIRWEGEPGQLSLSDYWKTPNNDKLFIGAYDCRYRIHRVGVKRL